MRLDFRNIGKGLEAIAAAKKAQDLAQAYAKPETSQGYTEEQGQQLEAMTKAINPETGRPYYNVQAAPGGNYTVTPDFTEAQTPMTGLGAGTPRGVASVELQPTGPGRAGLVAQPIPFNQQQVQDYGGRRVAGQFDPTELRGLQMQEVARVLGRYGDVRGATDLQTKAEELAYQSRIRPMQEEQMKRQGLLTEGQLADMNRNQARTKKLDAVDASVAQWQANRLIDPNTNEPRQPTMDDNIAALQYRATALREAGLAKEATESLRDYQGFAVNQIKLDETQRNSQLGAVALALSSGDLEPARAFYDRYVLDGAKVTGMATDPKTGAITVSRVRDDGTKLPDKIIKGGANELLVSLNSFRDPMALYNFSQNEFNNNLKTEEIGIRKESLNLQKDIATSNKLQSLRDESRKEALFNRPSRNNVMTFKNQAGEAVLVDMSKLKQNPDGTLQIPKGLTPVTTKTEPTDAAVAKLAESIIKDKRQWPMKNGKPVAPSPEQAGAMARAILRKNSGVTDESESVEDRLIRLIRASQQDQ